MNPYDVLELDPDNDDAKALRNAYSRKLREHRPDEDPQGFQLVREAYEMLKEARYYSDDDYDGVEPEAPESDEADDALPASLRETRVREPETGSAVHGPEQKATPSLAGQDISRAGLPDAYADALQRFFEGHSFALDELVWKLRGDGNIGALERIALLMERQSRDGLPRDGGFTVIAIATAVAPVRVKTAQRLASRAFVMLPVDQRHAETLDELDHIIAAVKEIRRCEPVGRLAMARIVATGAWDGQLDQGVKALVRTARKAPRDGAFHAWIKDTAPDLGRRIRFRREAPEQDATEEERGGGWSWFAAAWVIFLILRACSKSDLDDTPTYPPIDRDIADEEDIDKILEDLKEKLRKFEKRRRDDE